ncbi:MAG TPA: TIGR02996 domain-containing protein, partial [Kofleriaceae bacterium]
MQLEAVLERWRATRDPKLGALVIELAGAPDPAVVAPYDKLKPTALVTALLVALAPGAPLSSLVPVIDRVVRTARGSWPVVEQIAEMQPDPRLARLALALLQDFGALAHPSTKLWRRLLDVVEQHGDPSSIERLLALPAQETYVTSPERTSNIAKRLAKSSPLTDAQLAELEHETVRVSHDGRALLEAVYADPASDGAREVYADHLLGEGDPRGEFIQLQLQRAAGRTSPAGVKREAALLKKHAKTWLGSLAKVIGLPDAPSAVATELVVPVDAYRGVNFARGFVRRLPQLFVPANRSGIYDDPVWSTVEHVHALPRLTPVM